MKLQFAMILSAIAFTVPMTAVAQQYPSYGPQSSAVVRPVGHARLWEDYDGGCGCGGGGGCGCAAAPIAFHNCNPCNAPSCGCRPRPIIYAIGSLSRTLDCLFPCRPHLIGHCSGWGGCGPCNDPSCGGGCSPLLGRRCGFASCGCSTGGCSTGCDSCGTSVMPMGQPMPPPDSQVDPFRDDNGPPEPRPSDARHSQTRSPFAKVPPPAAKKRNTFTAVPTPAPAPVRIAAKPILPSRIVRPATHTDYVEEPALAQPTIEQTSGAYEPGIEQPNSSRRTLSARPIQSNFEVPHNPLRK